MKELTIKEARQRTEALQTEAAQVHTDYSQRLEKIQKDPDLSQAGKTKAIKALLAEQRAKIDGLVTKLRRAAVEEAAAADLAQGVRDLVKREYGNWDYGRLAYEANRVRSAFVLAGGDDFDRIEETWQQVKARGDKYEIKSWIDTAPALLPNVPNEWEQGYNPRTFGARQSIIEDIAASEIFTLTDEGKKFENERARRNENLELIGQAAAQVSQSLSGMGTFINGRGGEVYQPGNGLQNNHVIARVFDGIALDHKTGELHVDRKGGETAEHMYDRTEAAYLETVKQIEAVNDGQPFDALVYGVS